MRWLAVLLLLGPGGCAGLSEPDSAGNLDGSDIVLAGRITLDPPLRPDEQELQMLGSSRYRDRLLVAVGPEAIDMREPGFDTLRNAAMVTLGEVFYVRVPRRDTLVYSGGSILMNAHRSGRMDYLHLPGTVHFRTRQDDEIIYLGTLVYHRDVYNGITGVEIIDEFDASRQTFLRHFGRAMRTRRANLEELQ